MKSHITLVVTVLAGVAVAVVGGSVVFSSGCYYQTCDCDCDGGTDGDIEPDGETVGPCEGPIEETAPQALIVDHEAPGNYVTATAGQEINLTAALSPDWSAPMDCLLPITYAWDFGNGSTGTGETPGPTSYATPGYFTVAMTASNSQGTPDQVPDLFYVSLWSGTVFQDDFERDTIDHDNSGWSYRVSDFVEFTSAPPWEIVNHNGSRRLHTDWGAGTDFCQPATQGMIARLEATDAVVSVWQGRGTPAPERPHYSDIILRYRFNRPGASAPDSTYYRVRVMETHEAESEYCICLDLFKINGENEGGTGIGGSEINACGNPLCGYTEDFFYATVTITGTGASVTIDVAIDATPNPAVGWHSHTFVDNDAPITHSGRFGVSQCTGGTYFDNFRLERLD